MDVRLLKAALAAFCLLWSAQAFALIKDGNCYYDDNGNTVYCDPVETGGTATTASAVVVVGTYVDPWLTDWNRYIEFGLYDGQTGPALPEEQAGVGGRDPSTPTVSDNPGDNCGKTEEGNPVDYSNGEKVEYEYDFSSTGEVPLYLQRTYRSYWTYKGIFGYRWVSNFDLRLQKSADGNLVTLVDGEPGSVAVDR